MSATGPAHPAPSSRLTSGCHPEWERVAGLLAILGHPVRLRLLELLAGRPRTGTELAAALGLSRTQVSRQLAVLRRAGLLAGAEQGDARRWALHHPSVMDVVTRARAVLLAAAAAQPPDALGGAGHGPPPTTAAPPTTDTAPDQPTTPGERAGATAAPPGRAPRSGTRAS